MDIRTVFSLSSLMTSAIVFAQDAPSIQWQRCLGGFDFDVANEVQQAIDGGYIVAGWTASDDGDVTVNNGGVDLWAVKLNALGVLQWQRTYGGSGFDRASSVKEISDEGFILAGVTSSNDGDVSVNHGGEDVWVVKLDGAGSLVWQRTFGGAGEEQASEVIPTTDGGFALAGYTTSTDGEVTGNHGLSDFWVIKLDDSGTLQWQKTLGGASHDGASSVQQTLDGGFIVAGHTGSNDGDVSGSHGGWDFWIVKLDSMGNLEWQKALGGTNDDEASAVWQTSDGGFVVAGGSNSNDGDVSGNHESLFGWTTQDMWVVKLHAGGDLEWQKSLGGSSNESASDVRQTTDGGYILVGPTDGTGDLVGDGDINGSHGDRDGWVAKLDFSGSLLWQKPLGGSGADDGSSIEQTDDNGYVIAGNSASNDGDVTGNHGTFDCWVVKLNLDDVAIERFEHVIFSFEPNPSHGIVRIKSSMAGTGCLLTLYDLSGREILREAMRGHYHEMDLRSLSKGTYVFTLASDQSIHSERLVLE